MVRVKAFDGIRRGLNGGFGTAEMEEIFEDNAEYASLTHSSMNRMYEQSSEAARKTSEGAGTVLIGRSLKGLKETWEGL